MSDDLVKPTHLIAEALTEYYGPKCNFDFAEGCAACESWKQLEAWQAQADRIEELDAKLLALETAIEEKGGGPHAPTEWAYLKACEVLADHKAKLAEYQDDFGELPSLAYLRGVEDGKNSREPSNADWELIESVVVKDLEAKLAKAIEVLTVIDALDPESAINGCSEVALRGLVLGMGDLARAAIEELKGERYAQ